METNTARRPLKTRQREWAKAMASFLARQGVYPNTISILSIFFAALAGAAFYSSGISSPVHRILLLLVAAAGIQLRLLCNMLDGMVAVEGGRQSKSGEIFNDLPDRISDALILVPAGYAVPDLPYGPALGWCAALLAIFTAYVRLMGGAAGLKQSFIGPMAKPHRMAALTATCFLSVIEIKFLHPGTLLWITLVLMNFGCVVTIWRRTAQIIRELEAR
jgi:phosphatidylglycerophosphate synthase